ncbi:Protein kinase-like (PK-like) [Glarea lozoyensis ATCC 20868]|uniref:Protein kinase-like (PK-like) n=1 Tax=Glarea lozoyensis (strain ATCC 20868 / MF5171) TaxID=1116229 RepID=S3DCX5_GLAL2|nr:Protein kinase-like (PK-like) [Glarea lozoyensis ATCC 20868]EPE35585.1 Protein kinase-like (PK-like) [Glarea lozoyensis ATCC 20868]
MNPPLPFFLRAGRVVDCSTSTNANDHGFHFDLLSFISIAQDFGVDFISLTWQPALEALGRGATSTIQQTQIDAKFNLAFKLSMAWPEEQVADTAQQGFARYKALIYELIALEMLADHPNVIDLVGITWETGGDTHEVWPVLLTERSTEGLMDEFLNSSTGIELNCQSKLELCRDVAQAGQALHSLGIVHGDIKLENILIFKSEERWTGKLIDFGFSCLGTSDNDMVQVACTRPWQAPEHHRETYFKLEEARRMDVYSFGMLLCRMFLSSELTKYFKIFGHLFDAENRYLYLEEIESLKQSFSFLDMVLEALNKSSDLDNSVKETLREIFLKTLQHKPELRAPNFDYIVAILSTSDAIPFSPYKPTKALDRLAHTVLDIGKSLADLDDSDYLLRKAIVTALEKRMTKKNNCLCKLPAAYQLWLCYEIGFGTKRDTAKAAEWLVTSQSLHPDPKTILEEIDQAYEASNAERLSRKLGYATNLPFDPVKLYEIQNRMEMAEISFRQETQGRKESFEISSKSYITQLSNLSLLLCRKGDFKEAEKASRDAVNSSKAAYGALNDITISAQNYLAWIFSRTENWSEMVELQLELIPLKSEHKDIGPLDATTLNSQNHLIAAYFFLGEYDESISLATNLLETRKSHLGKEHPETLVTFTWLCRSLLEHGSFDGLEAQFKDLVAASRRACGDDDDATLEREELHAAVLLGEGYLTRGMLNEDKLDDALCLIEDVLNRYDDDVPNAHLNLLVKAHTTLICALALEERFEEAQTEIAESENVARKLQAKTNENYIEIRRFGRVVYDVNILQELSRDMQEHKEEIHQVRLRIAHRWKL